MPRSHLVRVQETGRITLPVAVRKELGIKRGELCSVAGKRAISADTAVRLGYWLGTGPEFWLDLRRQYELRLIEQTDGAAIRSRGTPLARTAA